MLTDRQIRAIKANGKEQKFSDNLNGLVLKVTPKGAKVWIIRINLNGKERTLTLKPHYPALSLSDARIEAEKAQSLRKQGINPAQLKQEAKKEQQAALLNTFEHLAREWHTHQLARWTTTHAKRVLADFERDTFPQIGHLPIDTVSVENVKQVIERIAAKPALVSAEKMRQWIGAVFEYAGKLELTERNPAHRLKGHIPKPKTNHRAALPISELTAFFSSLHTANIEHSNRIAIILIMLTALRNKELRGALWQEIDFAARVWTIPAERMKGTKANKQAGKVNAHQIPLSTWAIELLNELHTITGHTPFLFPSRTKANAPISEATLTRIVERLGFQGVASIHGFRAAASSALNEQGFNPDAIERQLAHIEPNRVRAAYNRAAYWTERVTMMQHYSDFLYSHYQAAQSSLYP